MYEVIVLNQNYIYLNTVSYKKAICYVERGKAQVEKYSDAVLRTVSIEYKVPLIIRLVTFAKCVYKRKIPWSKRNVILRDNKTCVYCGSKHKINIDHILPRSRGGKNTYENTVASCFKCNNYKDNKTPAEANMKFFKPGYTPKSPTVLDFMVIRLKNTSAFDILKQHGMI